MSKWTRSAMAVRIGVATLTAAAVAVVVSGVSSASIPDSNGVIHGCYKAQGASSPLSVLNTATHPSCPSGYTAIHWDAAPPSIGVGTGVAAPGTTGGATCDMGEVSLFAQHGATLPTSFLIAKGQSLKIASYTALFALLGTTYGGNGTSTFKLPSLQGLAPDHMTYAICIYGIYP
jgi:hypothetical protein